MLLAVVTAAVACALVAGSQGAEAGGKRPIKVGYLLPLTGPFAGTGQNASRGFNLGLKLFSSNRVLNGHPLEIKYRDTQGSPTLVLNHTRELVERERVDILQGPITSPEAGPFAAYVAPRRIPTDDVQLCSELQLDYYTRFDYGYASGWSCDQGGLMAAVWAAKVKRWKRVTIVARDLTFGWENAGAFAAVFRKLGGRVSFVWYPLNATDLAPYVSQIPKDSDAVFVDAPNVLAVRFLKAYKDFGLKGRIPVVGSVAFSDSAVLPAHETANVLGVYTAVPYCDGIKSRLNEIFVRQYRQAYGGLPSNASEVGFTKARILVNALKRLGGDASNRKRVIEAMKSTAIVAARGPVRLNRKYLAPVQNIYICQLKRVNGELRNVPVHTFRNVQPFGPLRETEWVAHFRKHASERPE